jgi:hypothetical protein
LITRIEILLYLGVVPGPTIQGRTTKKKIVAMMALAVILLGAGSASAAPKAWLDLENCGMCKNLLVDMDLFQHMTWDTYLLTNGMMEVTTHPTGYEDRFKKLMASFESCGAR